MRSLTPKLFVKRGSTLAMILAAVTTLTSCVSSRLQPVVALPAPTIRAMPLGNGSAADPWRVTIHFENATSCKITHVTEDPATCPNVPLPGFCLARGDRIRCRRNPAIQRRSHLDRLVEGRDARDLGGHCDVARRRPGARTDWAATRDYHCRRGPDRGDPRPPHDCPDAGHLAAEEDVRRATGSGSARTGARGDLDRESRGR